MIGNGNSSSDDPKLTAMLESLTTSTNSILQSLNAQKETMVQFTEMLQKLVERLPEESDRERESKVFIDFLEIQSRTYYGGLDVEEAENWVFQMEKTFGVIPYDEPTKVKLAAFMLEGDALRWWLQTKEREGEVPTLERFKELFLGKYFPSSERARKREEFLHLEQGDMTVRETHTRETHTNLRR